jgi:hypothetical protein
MTMKNADHHMYHCNTTWKKENTDASFSAAEGKDGEVEKPGRTRQ